MKKIILFLLGICFVLLWFTFATDYIYFYGDGNLESEEVENFFIKEKIENDYELLKYDIYFQDEAWEYFIEKVQDYNIPSSKWEMPILIVEENGYAKIFTGKGEVKNYFKNPKTFVYYKKVKIPDTQVKDYVKLSGKEKKTAQKIVSIIEKKLQKISKWNIRIKIKLYDMLFKKLENIIEMKQNLKTKILVYYVKVNMVIEYLQLLKKIK